MKADIGKAVKTYLNDCDKIMVVANLPYYITTPILLNLMQQDIPIDGYVVMMMQKEVGERLNASRNKRLMVHYLSLHSTIQKQVKRC